jgi:heat shock protein HslJ
MARKSRFRAAAVALGILMAGVGCSTADEPATPLAGSWRAETIIGRPVIDDSTSTVNFEADGRVHGRGGCNRYFGSSTIEGDQMSFGPLGSTKMACAEALMDQETRFFQALESAERWTIDDQGLLLIYSAGAEEPSRFAPFEE